MGLHKDTRKTWLHSPGPQRPTEGSGPASVPYKVTEGARKDNRHTHE